MRNQPGYTAMGLRKPGRVLPGTLRQEEWDKKKKKESLHKSLKKGR